MNILLICNSIDGIGGWCTYTKILKKGLEERGHIVSLCCHEGHKPYDALGTPIGTLVNPILVIRNALHIRRTVKKFQPDIIHYTVEPYVLTVPFLGKNLKSRIVLTIHGSYGIRLFQHPLTAWIAKKAFGHITQFITVSRYTKKAVTTYLQKRGWQQIADHVNNHTSVIHNAIPSIQQNKSENHRDPAHKHIMVVGGVKPRKGIIESLEACALYKKKYGTPFTFQIIGNPHKESEYTKRVNQKIDELDLTKEVEFSGFVSPQELQKKYEGADLYLMPAQTSENTFEGFGLVYLEANAHGIPCIGTNTSGAAEVIKEGETGYKMDPRDTEGIAERMHWILDEEHIDPKDCVRWAQEHSIEKMVKQVESVYVLLKK